MHPLESGLRLWIEHYGDEGLKVADDTLERVRDTFWAYPRYRKIVDEKMAERGLTPRKRAPEVPLEQRVREGGEQGGVKSRRTLTSSQASEMARKSVESRRQKPSGWGHDG